MATGSGSLHNSRVVIHDTSTTDGGQSFAGVSHGTVNFGTINYDGSGKDSDTTEEAAIKCRNALFLTDPYVDRESVISAKGTRVAGTCEWISRDDRYRAWRDGDGSSNDRTRLLWISGGPGKGKTMMSVYLTQELEKHTAGIENAELVFFFCNAQDEKRNTAVVILRGLVYQIVKKRPQLIKHALPYFENDERTQQTLSSLETLWIIFNKLFADAELGTIFCVLDGLDECEESTLRVLLPRFIGLFAGEAPSSNRGIFKLTIVSRDMPVLRKCIRIRLDPDNNEKVTSDVERFISARVGELSMIEGLDDEHHQAHLQNVLLERAEGTFLWVGFAMHELLQMPTLSEIWEAVGDLPSGLPAIYDRMLLRIPAKKREMSSTIMRWIILAARPLTLPELATAIGIIRPSHPGMTLEQATRDAVALCRPLLEIQDQKISFVHQSARDYLLRKERDSDAVLESFRIETEPSHLQLAQKCLESIAQSDLRHKDVGPYELGSPFLEYAVYHWHQHAKGCSTLVTKLFDPFGFFLQEESPLRVHWRNTFVRSIYTIGYYLPSPAPMLHTACALEIVPWIQAVLENESSGSGLHQRIDDKDDRGQTALHFAVLKSNEAVVRLLLKKGANVHAKDEYWDTALHWADDEAVVQLLLENGADVNARRENENTALHRAVKTSNEAVVRLLLKKGADVKAKDEYGDTALHKARDEAVVRLLLEKGADVNAKDEYENTALHKVVKKSNEAVVQLLLEKGANVNAKNKDGYTALHWAKDEAVVQLLLKKGANVNAKNKDGYTALHWAKNEAVVQLLLKKGANVNAKNKDGYTALHWAKDEAVVQLLLEKRANVNAKDMNGETALHRAVIILNEAVVQLLLEKGADVNAKDEYGNTALHGAEDEAVVQLLLENRADVNARNGFGNTALHCAAERLNGVVVQLLLEKGADVNAKGEDGDTALHYAVIMSNEAVVQLLLEKGADVNATNNEGMTALQQAVREGQIWVAKPLIEWGANVNARAPDSKGEPSLTALELAVRFADREMVQLLLENGADVEEPRRADSSRTCDGLGGQVTGYGANMRQFPKDCE